jgi:hypothetical protein
MCNPYSFPRGCFSALWATLKDVSVVGAVTSGGGIGAAISGLGTFPHPTSPTIRRLFGGGPTSMESLLHSILLIIHYIYERTKMHFIFFHSKIKRRLLEPTRCDLSFPSNQHLKGDVVTMIELVKINDTQTTRCCSSSRN